MACPCFSRKSPLPKQSFENSVNRRRPSILTGPGLTGFPGGKTFHAKTRAVPGKHSWLVTPEQLPIVKRIQHETPQTLNPTSKADPGDKIHMCHSLAGAGDVFSLINQMIMIVLMDMH